MISKNLFINTINALKLQEEYDSKCTDAFQTILDEDRITIGYNNSILTSQIVKILEELTNDRGEWIQYFLYELDYGKDYREGCATNEDKSPIDLSSSENLYDFLVKNSEDKLLNDDLD